MQLGLRESVTFVLILNKFGRGPELHKLFRELGTMIGDQLPCALLHPCIGAHYTSRTMLAMIEGVVGFREIRDSRVAIGANLEVTHLLLVGLVGLWVAHIL